ncbi:MAG: O-antigen ligase domain-containing protein [Phycisphaerales bacterium]
MFSDFALFGWPFVALIAFVMLPVRRAVFFAVITGWLMLPNDGHLLPGLPDYTKSTAVSLSALVGIVMFDSRTLLAFRPRWVDGPAVMLCIAPFFSSVTNGLGAYDGVSAAIGNTFIWGIPYLAGRLYVRNLDDARELAIALMIGGLMYAPLCLYEIRMAPVLHSYVYGFHQHDFVQTMRLGGWRPVVFLTHGLAVGAWMAVTAMVAVGLWILGGVRSWRQIPMSAIAGGLTVTSVLVKSLGAMGLMFMSFAVIAGMRFTGRWTLIAVLAMAGPGYLGLRVVSGWEMTEVIGFIDSTVGEARADSLETRVLNEIVLTERALERPIFGWGGWGRMRDTARDDGGRIITDSMWIIALGETGLFGLTGLIALHMVPTLALTRRRKLLLSRGRAGFGVAVVLGLGVIMVMFDSLLNAMPNPAFILMMAALASLAVAPLPVPAGQPAGQPNGSGGTANAAGRGFGPGLGVAAAAGMAHDGPAELGGAPAAGSRQLPPARVHPAVRRMEAVRARAAQRNALPDTGPARGRAAELPPGSAPNPTIRRRPADDESRPPADEPRPGPADDAS